MDRSLEELEPHLVSANVRDRFSGTGLRVADGIGGVGDLTFANNPTLLLMPEIRGNWMGMIVVSGDPLSCYGVARYLSEELGVPSESVRHFSSPFWNPAGMKARAEVMGVEDISDPKSPSEIEAVLRSLLGDRALQPGPFLSARIIQKECRNHPVRHTDSRD